MAIPKAYAILPASNAPAEQVVRSLMSLRRSTCSILYLHGPGEAAPSGPDVIPVQIESLNLGAMIERARLSEAADLYLWIPPGVEVLKDGPEKFIYAYGEDPEAGLFVSNYLIGKRTVDLFPLRDDITEREDFGAVWGISARALEEVQGADPNLKYAVFYDLRLKISECARLHHIKEPTFQIDTVEDSTAAHKLFFPGRGAYGGFSYLFMEPEEQEEVEQVFLHCLKRRGALLKPRKHRVQPAETKAGDPIVTVIIPVHDRANLLPKAIDSVIAGSLQDFEIIVVDNVSTDNSRDIADEYASRDPRIRVLASEINLIAHALNLGVGAARGRYIAQLDSDDEYTPRTLERMVGHLESNPECGLAISYYELMDEGGATLEQYGVIKHLEYSVNNILRVDGAGAVRVWHHSVIEEYGGFNEVDFPNYGEDYDLVLKVGERYSVDRVHEVLYRYRRHPGNTDALRRPEDKIRAKTLARKRAIERRCEINRTVSVNQ